MKRDCRGMTLLELVVTIAISGIILGIVTWSVFPSYSAAAKSCATRTDSLIAKLKLGCLSHADYVHLTLHTDINGNIVGDYYESASSLVSSDILADKRVSLGYTLSGTSGAPTKINLSDTPLTLSFDRQTGAFKLQSDGSSYCTSITVSCGSVVYTITLVPATGVFTLS